MIRLENLARAVGNRRRHLVLHKESRYEERKTVMHISEIISCMSNGHPNAQRIGDELYCSVCETSYPVNVHN